SSLLEPRDVDVADSWTNQEVDVDAIAGNLIANHSKVQRLVRTFAQNGDLDAGALGTLQQFGNIAGTHVVGLLAIDGNDDVTRANSRTVSGCAGERRNHNNLIVAR